MMTTTNVNLCRARNSYFYIILKVKSTQSQKYSFSCKLYSENKCKQTLIYHSTQLHPESNWYKSCHSTVSLFKSSNNCCSKMFISHCGTVWSKYTSSDAK